MNMTRYFVTIPRPWASFEFSCNNLQGALALFARSTVYDPWASLYARTKEDHNRIARREDGQLITRANGWRPLERGEGEK